MSDLVERLKINGEAWSNEASRDYEVQHFITLAKVQSRLQHEAAARITELEAALEQSREWFQQYADSHTAKGDTDKAKRNQDRADFCARASLGGSDE